MIRFLPTFLLLLCVTSFLHGQRKSDLIAEIEALKIELDSTNNIVIEARKNEKVGVTRAESYEKQVVELQDANRTLLKNLNSFASISNTNSENLNKALEKIEEKERQLKDITNAFSSHDSTALVVLTNAKHSLGENARIGVADGKVLISSKLEALFSSTSESKVLPESHSWLEKIAAIMKANPKTKITIEGLSMTGELELAANQALAIGKVLTDQFEIEPTRVNSLGKDGNFKEGANLVLHPDYTTFYKMVKENIKSTN